MAELPLSYTRSFCHERRIIRSLTSLALQARAGPGPNIAKPHSALPS